MSQIRRGYEPPTDAQLQTCELLGHAMRDRFGKCVRCGRPVPPPAPSGTPCE